MYYTSILHYEYSLDGRYTANATAWNLVNSRTSSSIAYVQLRPCQLPDIHIRDGSEVTSDLFKYKRYQNILFIPVIKLDCQGSIQTILDWKVFKISGTFSIPDETNEYHLPSNIKTSLKEFYIPSFTLDYGYYIFQLTVTMVMRDGSIGVSNVDHSKLEVVETSLVAWIIGGSLIRTGWYNNITIDGSESHDPDSAVAKFVYNWFCRTENETFPDDFNELMNTKTISKGGCLRNGMHIKSSYESKLFIPAQTLEGNNTFVFRLVITEPGRDPISTQQTIYISPGRPPSLHIRCIMNCETFLNPSERLILSGKCGDCTEFTRPSYLWYLIPKSTSNRKQELVWGHDTTTSQVNAYLSLHANVFNAENSEIYTLRLTIRSWSGSSSYSEFMFSINARPRGGTCSVNPTEGIVLSTLFAIQCLEFYDDDIPLHYVVHAETGAEVVAGVSSLKDHSEDGNLIYYGVDPVFTPTLLPIGRDENNFIVKINIKVLDAYGAYTDTFLDVKVMPPQVVEGKDIEDVALEMTTAEDSKLDQLLTDGDTQSAVQLITTVGSILNAEAEKSHSESGSITKKKVKKEEKKQKRTEAREAIIESIQNVEIRDMESLKQTSAAITQVTQEREEISDKAQRYAAEVYVNLGKYLNEQSSIGVGGEAVEGTARYILSGISNIMSTTAPPPQTKNKISMESEDKKDYASQNRNVTLVSMKSLEQVKSAILVNKVPGEKPTRLETDIMSVVLQKQEKWDIDGLVCEDVDSGIAFRLPDNIHSEITVSDDNYDEVIDIKMNNFKSNPFIWDESSTSVTSQVTSLELNKPDGKAIILENLPETIDMFIANPQPVPVVSLPGIYLDNTTASLTYGFNLTSNEGSLVLLVNPNNITSTMTLYMRYQYPSNGSQYDLAMDLPLHVNNVTVNWNATTNLTGNIFTLVINTDNLLGIGSYFITVDSQNATDDNYTISAFMANCLYWNTEVEQWNTDGCQVGVLTTENVLHCQCSHLTFFGGSFFVLPNTIHFVEDAKLFKGFLDNPVVISAVIVVFCLQVLCSIWARRKDKTDQLQAHLIVLHDNDPLHCHRYHVTIFTGMRSGAGTSAIVTLTLSGLLGKTKPHVMTSKTRKVLQQGSSDSFLLTTKESLGDLLSVRVWHDNSGSHPEWYLSRILIHEVDSEKCWYFLCKSWLAVDIGDCVIDQTFLAATKDELNLFHNQFLIKSMKEFRDGHLWFSVITRPASSSFTRLQRIACCFSVLFTSMLTSIMFYGVPDDPDTQDLDFGKFQISWREIIIGIECSILVFPINFFTVTLFRNARCNKDEVVLLEIEGLIDDDSDIPLYFLESNDNSEYSAFSSSDTAESNRKQSICKCKSTMTLERKPEAVGIESNKKHGCLPWWIIYFAWFILFSCEGVSAYVIMLYGLKYGKQRSLDWLMSILIAFFQNIFVIQPTEMIFIAALLSLLFKMKEKEDVGVQLFKNFHIVKSEHHQTVDCKYNMDHYRPPPIQAVEIARKKRQADFKLHSILREFVGQLILVWLVMEIVYTQQDPNSFYFNKIIQDTFTDTLDEVSSFVDLFEWLRETAGPAWFDQTSEFLSNTSSVLVGTVRLRQLRVLPESCSEPRVINSTLIPECTSPLTKHNLDKRSYTKPWSTTGHHIPGQGIWSFQHKHKAKGSYFVGKLHVYDRGGHIAELRGNISAANNILGTLQKSKWFEKHTRAVFIEWTLYNADVNLFCVCTLLFEVPGTGALIASSEFLVMRLYRFTSKLQMFVLVLEISYIFVLVFMMYKEVSRFYQRGLKYFNTWSILTLCNITSSLIAVVLYNIRLALANIALEQINKTTNIFISFNDVAIHHQVFGYVISIVVVGTTLKLLKMLRFNNSIFLMSNTISKISANAFSCFCTISIAMMAFATYSYLIFGPIIYDFSTLVSCLENIAVIMVGGSEVMEEVYYYFPLIGSLFFALITLTFAYVLLNAFVAMMLDAFTEIKHGFIPCPDKDIISMLVNRFYSLLGIRRPQIRLQENGDLLKVNNE
ncbi:polycystin-1-like protein 2 [Antedon mediterranea]|uniref:polycystin-1-like protein 2 n=1 Tax=Antedon mediterranea TaxID=105859 RepID=UPI003AF51B77